LNNANNNQTDDGDGDGGAGGIVNGDFAFVKVVDKPEHVERLSPEYRIAPFMSYPEMQEHKYILDIDGNGMLLHANVESIIRSLAHHDDIPIS
jgi:hypothetical protein